jgi:hypothetical protein
MNDTFLFILQVIFLVWFTRIFVNAMLGLMEAKRQIKLEEMKMLEEIAHRVSVEKHGDIYYWYDFDDGEFLGQGKTTEDVVKIIQSRFPKHIFFLSAEDKVTYKIHGPDWQFRPVKI